MQNRHPLLLTFITLTVGLSAPVANAQKMYWFVDSNVQRACLSGSPIQDVIGGIRLLGIALDTGSGKLYWTDRLTGSTAQIKRANLDGTDVEILTGDSTYAAAIALDTVVGKVYWIEGTHGISRSNLDGSGAEVLLTDLDWPKHLALDVGAGKIYWTTSFFGYKIMRANLDGSNMEVALDLEGSFSPGDIALDTVAGRMYWTSTHSISTNPYGFIHSANLDGSQPDQFPLDTDYPNGIALDLGAGKVYWGGGDYLSWAEIKRANLDGSNVEEILSATTFHPEGIALDLRSCGGPDCQPNGVPDECDICDGTSEDCNANDIPDECEPDCNFDGIPDACDPDCNSNEISDLCDILAGTSADILPQGGDGIPDECQLDCNGNDIPDIDDLAAGTSEDCNNNDRPDECDIADEISEDCDLNGVPDECEPDCNENGQADTCDIQTGISADCNENTVPDECEPDCNGNQIADECDIATGTSEDGNGNGYPDECEATNDSCVDAIEIFAGNTPYDSLIATSDGPQLSYNCPIICEFPCYIADIWYSYVAPGDGLVTITAVSDSGSDLTVLVYDGCSCPVDAANLVGCGLEQSIAFTVQAGTCYQLQVGTTWGTVGESGGTIELTTNFPTPCPARPPFAIFVDADAPPGGDGLSWPTALTLLQDALAIASAPGSEVTEIRVAEGTYTPNQAGDDRTATFQLPGCVAMMGGYAGLGSADPDLRDIVIHETILSGDLVGNDEDETSDCCYSHNWEGCADPACESLVCASSPSCCDSAWLDGCVDLAASMCGALCATLSDDNSYHVVTACDVHEMTILDGFIITGGNADGSTPHNHGAGIECDFAAPTIRDCTIRGNIAKDGGGGVHNCDGKIVGCLITDNSVTFGEGGSLEDCDGLISKCTISDSTARWGAGLYRCDATIENCTITGNAADVAGGGMAFCNGTITHCSIIGNTSGNAGGGAYSCDGAITNCLISGNTALIDGGGLSYCDASVVNSTFTGNIATAINRGGAVSYCTGGFTNCIFWDNNSWWYNSSPSPTFSCMPASGFAGSGNVQADPLFVVAGFRDNDGKWVEGDYRLSLDSPCIDAGDDFAVPADTTDLDGDGDITEPIPFDLDGNPRFVGPVDMGAFESGTNLTSPTRAAPPHDILKNRYLSVDPTGGGKNPPSHHIRLMVDSSQVNGLQLPANPWWAGPPDANCVSVVTTIKPAEEPDWSGCTAVHLTGCPIIPTTTYTIAAETGGVLSPDGLLSTQAKPGVKWHGDTVGFFNGALWTPPNGVTNVDDTVACIKTFQNPNALNATHLSVTDLEPNLSGSQINLVVNIADCFTTILGFQGNQYPGSMLTLCP